MVFIIGKRDEAIQFALDQTKTGVVLKDATIEMMPKTMTDWHCNSQAMHDKMLMNRQLVSCIVVSKDKLPGTCGGKSWIFLGVQPKVGCPHVQLLLLQSRELILAVDVASVAKSVHQLTRPS
ncbi:expressed unknown protein [Seminavis robusta]|uniref:Uncharacterized protein n=1 Tax=Seminavis robusta TaxID=568900 RepID=A0A9N8EI87_9STRA|nr:expressed unknown protein [Seminavis robusta]|eukprot:Sro1142_g245860.1 n/a (122) ;mRNA; f:28646-29102